LDLVAWAGSGGGSSRSRGAVQAGGLEVHLHSASCGLLVWQDSQKVSPVETRSAQSGVDRGVNYVVRLHQQTQCLGRTRPNTGYKGFTLVVGLGKVVFVVVFV
jgi:hypothetical protein